MTTHQPRVPPNPRIDVLVVGAGPTGLALAAQLRTFGARFRIVDRQLDRAHESRALAIQPRTLEVLAGLGISDRLVAAGNPAVQLRLHFQRRTVPIPLFDLGLDDTAYPFLLFLSQAETERIIGEHLEREQVAIERGIEFVDLNLGHDHVNCQLRHPDGRVETISARYVVGCDGARSTVREKAGIEFAGVAYPQTFLLADLEIDGLEVGAVHAYVADLGMLLFFPLGKPATWRVIALVPATTDAQAGEVTLGQLQAIVDAYTQDRLVLRDPVWMNEFRLHNRAAARYRAGPAFVAGDAAHIHSPAGAQGMNTGIQDAINLGWKLAFVARGIASPALLDSYEPERAPVGEAVLRFTDRAFTMATSSSALPRFARRELAPLLAPLALRLPAARAAGFRLVSELGVRYRQSPAVATGPYAPRHGARAGDRLPDAPIVRDGARTTLHAAIAEPPGHHLLLCGPLASWETGQVTMLARRYAGLLTVDRLTHEDGPDVLHDVDGLALRRLGQSFGDLAHYLVRPDGYIGYRAGGIDLTDLTNYLNHWLTDPSARVSAPG